MKLGDFSKTKDKQFVLTSDDKNIGAVEKINVYSIIVKNLQNHKPLKYKIPKKLIVENSNNRIILSFSIEKIGNYIIKADDGGGPRKHTRHIGTKSKKDSGETRRRGDDGGRPKFNRKTKVTKSDDGGGPRKSKKITWKNK